MTEFDWESCCDLNIALRSEWLETNGIGGFSSSTIYGSEHSPVSRSAYSGNEAASRPVCLNDVVHI